MIASSRWMNWVRALDVQIGFSFRIGHLVTDLAAENAFALQTPFLRHVSAGVQSLGKREFRPELEVAAIAGEYAGERDGQPDKH